MPTLWDTFAYVGIGAVALVAALIVIAVIDRMIEWRDEMAERE